MVLQLPSKEPPKADTKPLGVPPYISANSVDNSNQSSHSTDKKNANLHNTVKLQNRLDDKHSMNEPKILNDSTVTMRLVKRIENWSPSTAKYARLSIFGCKVSKHYKSIKQLLF